MGCCGKCCKGLFLTLLSVVTMGVIAACLIAAVIVCKTENINKISKTVFIILIVVCVLACLLFVFSLYASCCGKRCAKIVLGILFLVFSVILIIFGICVLALKDKIMDSVAKIWDITDKDYDAENKQNIEDIFKCCGWNIHLCVSQMTAEKTCKVLLDDTFDKYGKIVGIILIVLAVLLIIGAILAFCSKKGRDSSG
ncbi:hypothetical protein TRFO_43023 [Tritrichomonas foetus]|uniref:Tetraspanin family protein n=1 Tax=Tritrichomonas foetus TaxID=1144522 RepID=A0A1J4KTP3_9EUKA|nr:hypothetical protein TRFO_43023 [Tritrichomonas foetus]|eukprot:OHT14506.1 hypothetical protein TRFO_43023 [Tritrichomonas foetus]